jgi:hypothetical protein
MVAEAGPQVDKQNKGQARPQSMAFMKMMVPTDLKFTSLRSTAEGGPDGYRGNGRRDKQEQSRWRRKGISGRSASRAERQVNAVRLRHARKAPQGAVAGTAASPGRRACLPRPAEARVREADKRHERRSEAGNGSPAVHRGREPAG